MHEIAQEEYYDYADDVDPGADDNRSAGDDCCIVVGLVESGLLGHARSWPPKRTRPCCRRGIRMKAWVEGLRILGSCFALDESFRASMYSAIFA